MLHHSLSLTYFTLLLSLVVLTGCQHTAGRPHRVDLVQDPDKAEYVEKQLIELEKQYDAAKTQERRQEIRDQFARKMIALIDQRYNSFLDDLVSQRKAFDATADITAVTLDTASVLFDPASTKSILAGLSGLTTSSKTAFNKAYFYEKTLPALISQMSADRQLVLANIQEQLMIGVQTYPLHRLLSDLNRYYNAGTIDGAIQHIQRQAAKKAEAAEEKMRRQVEADIQAAQTRHATALARVKNKASFNELKRRISEWWSRLNADVKWEQVDVIATWAEEHDVDRAPLLQANNGEPFPHPKKMGSFLDSLDHQSAADRLMLADIARNAAGIELPSNGDDEQ